MMETIMTLYKTVDRERRIICGHFNREEISTFKREGWRKDAPQVNGNGIPVKFKKEKGVGK